MRVAALALAAPGVLHGVALVEDDHSVETGAQPIDDLPYPGNPFLARVVPQRGVGGEKDALLQTDRRPLAKARERSHQQPFHAERRPVALGVLDQLIGLADPHRAAAALQPVVEQDAGDLAALSRAGAVSQKPATPELHGIVRIVTRRADEVISLVDRPRSRQELRVGLTRINDGLKLRIGQQTVGDDVSRKVRPIGRDRRRHRRHGG